MKGVTEPCDFCKALRRALYMWLVHGNTARNSWTLGSQWVWGMFGVTYQVVLGMGWAGWSAIFVGYLAADFVIWWRNEGPDEVDVYDG